MACVARNLGCRWIAPLLAACLSLATGGCVTGGAGQDGSFSIDAMVSPPPIFETPYTAARYIVQPDGAFRVALGDATLDTFPPVARVLTPAEMDRLRSLTEASGLAERGGPGAVGAIDDASLSTGAASLWSIGMGGERAAFALDSSQTRRALPLIAELERLAWVRD